VSTEAFIAQLKAQGFQVESKGDGRIMFSYKIPVGKLLGQEVQLGFKVPPDFPMTPPSGPHVSPRLHPLHPGNDIPAPFGGVHESPDFGPDWQYWSRPFREWQSGKYSAREYMAFIRKLFADQ
jgi:hypothetical protein